MVLNSRPFLSVAGIHTLKKLWSKNSWKDSLLTERFVPHYKLLSPNYHEFWMTCDRPGFAQSSLVHISTESGRKLDSRGLENGRDALLFMH